MSQLLAFIYNGTCREIQKRNTSAANSSSSPNGSEKVTISSSVGLRSTNFPIDVTKIQNALNRIHPGYGGPEKPLIPDGICGSKTVAAIQKFQLRHFDWKGADGIINPNGETIAKINEALAAPRPPEIKVYKHDAPKVQEVFKRTMEVYLVEARRWVHETRYELMALEPFIDTLDLQSEHYRRFNEHFAIDKATDRRRSLRKILQVYEDMERAFQRHQGSGRTVFELYRGAATGTDGIGAIIAFTEVAGFYRNGVETDSLQFGKTFNDKIYLMPTGMVHRATYNEKFYISVLIHELAHYVGGWHSVGTIEDWWEIGKHDILLRSANAYQRYAEAVAHPNG